MRISEWLFILVLMLDYVVAFHIGRSSGYRKAKKEAPSDEAWLEAKKYELDKSWEYIYLRLEKEATDNVG